MFSSTLVLLLDMYRLFYIYLSGLRAGLVDGSGDVRSESRGSRDLVCVQSKL